MRLARVASYYKRPYPRTVVIAAVEVVCINESLLPAQSIEKRAARACSERKSETTLPREITAESLSQVWETIGLQSRRRGGCHAPHLQAASPNRRTVRRSSRIAVAGSGGLFVIFLT